MRVRFNFPAGGQVIRVPLTISIPKYETLSDLESLEFVITSSDRVPLSVLVDLICDSDISRIISPDDIQVSIAKQVESLTDSMSITGAAQVPRHIDVGILNDGDGELGLTITASDSVFVYRSEPLTIGDIDPDSVGFLDPSPVPDGRTL